MNDIPYSNREIEEKWNEITASLDRIERQTTAINGRVSKNEQWRYIMMGGITVLTTIVVPLLGWALYVLANIQVQVYKSVDQALSTYNIVK